MWRLPDQSREFVADMIATHYRDLAWCWVAMKSTAGEWRVASIALRPPYADVPDINLV
jgi:hypothetical protein